MHLSDFTLFDLTLRKDTSQFREDVKLSLYPGDQIFFKNKILVDPANIFHFSSGDDKKPEMHCRKHCIVLEIMQCNYNAPSSS